MNSSQSMEFISIPFISFINSIHAFFSIFSWFCTHPHPLFSTIVTLYTLLLLYAPSFFLRIVLSPVLNSTAIILLFLLKLGAEERFGNDLKCQELRIHDSSGNETLQKESSFLETRVLDHKERCHAHSSKECGESTLYSSLEERFVDVVDHSTQENLEFMTKVESNQRDVDIENDLEPESDSQDDFRHKSSMDSSQVVEKGESTIMELDSMHVDVAMKVLEWNMKAPLEIIYEGYEGEEDDDVDGNESDMISSAKHVMGYESYPHNLLMCYSESDGDSSLDDDFSIEEKWEMKETLFFKWESEDYEREELIEISLDCYQDGSCIELSQDEEDNLIEIDIDIFP